MDGTQNVLHRFPLMSGLSTVIEISLVQLEYRESLPSA